MTLNIPQMNDNFGYSNSINGIMILNIPEVNDNLGF
jgi:hypothetical protein